MLHSITQYRGTSCMIKPNDLVLCTKQFTWRASSKEKNDHKQCSIVCIERHDRV